MSFKTAITLVIGLVFQLTQLSTGAVSTSPCQTQQVSCDCCSGASSCGCAENNDPEQQQAPTPFSADNLLKIPAMRFTETNVSADPPWDIDRTTKITESPRAGPVSGYTGVSLSVAFCSFVI